MLALGRALMGQPELLMLDEPSLGLAPLVVKSIFATIASLRATGVTILLVEQNARAALEVADYAYVLEMGEIALEGPAAELARDPRVIDTYLGAARAEGADRRAMWHYTPPLRDMRFVIEELLCLPSHWAAMPAFAELDRTLRGR